MELKIIKVGDEKITIGFNKEILEVFLKEEDFQKENNWNSNKINEFLISLTASLPDNEKIEIKHDKCDDDIFKHIVSLFQVFVNEYNEQNNSL